jgi:hypothetical protein
VTESPATATPLTDDELRSQQVEVRWEIRNEYRAAVSLIELLQGLDFNEDDWRNEDGTCRFTSVKDAIRWARDEGLRGIWTEDFLSQFETESNLRDTDFDAYDVSLRQVVKPDA